MAHRLPMIEKCPHCETGTAARRGKRFNSKGEFTQWEFTCRDCKSFWSIRAGGDLNLVPNDLAVIPVSAIEPFPGLPENERLIRQVFSLYPRWNRGQIGRALGRSREWVRQVLMGITSAHIAPDLERFSNPTLNATCHGCVSAAPSGSRKRWTTRTLRCSAPCLNRRRGARSPPVNRARRRPWPQQRGVSGEQGEAWRPEGWGWGWRPA